MSKKPDCENTDVSRSPAKPGLARGGSVVLAASLILAGPSAALAQQWIFSPLVEVAAQHIDNPRLEETGDTDDISGGLVDLGAEWRRNTPTSSVVFRPSAQVYRYGSDSNEDSEAYLVDFDAENRGQRSEWRLRANYRQQQVFRGETTPAEIDDIGLEDDVQTGTGQTFERRQRDLFRIRPGFTFELTERTGLSLDLNYLDVQYDTDELGEAVDYANTRADIGLVRALTPDSSLTFGVFGQTYDPDSATRRETESIGARVRYEKDVTDISSFFIEVGGQESDIQNPVDPLTDVSETSYLWNVGYDRRLERTRWRFDVGQQVTPSGSGFMVERDLARVIMQHQLKPRWLLELSGVFMQTDTLGVEDVVTANDRDWAEGRITLGYQVTRSWTVEGLYRLTHQDFADIPGDAQEHEFRLSLVYRPPLPN